jgi:hypothetical protein
MRHQPRIDRRQRVECDAWIAHPFRPDESKRRGALRPERVGQNVHARRLQQNRRVPDERDTPLGARNPCRRPVGIRARCPCRPFGLAAADVPAQQLCNAIGRRAVRIEKPQAVEVIRHRAVVVARRRGANAKTAESSGNGGESGEHAAPGDFHMRRFSPGFPWMNLKWRERYALWRQAFSEPCMSSLLAPMRSPGTCALRASGGF